MERHTCHAIGCSKHCKPEYLMCRKHWSMVHAILQEKVYKYYRPGQCEDMKPSRNWMMAAERAINFVAVREGRMDAETRDELENNLAQTLFMRKGLKGGKRI